MEIIQIQYLLCYEKIYTHVCETLYSEETKMSELKH